MREGVARALLLLGAPIVLWGLVEGAAWLAGMEPLSGDRHYAAFANHRSCQFGWRDADALCDPAQLPAPGRRLLVTLGGSSVYGYPPGRAVPLAQPLRGLLEEAEPGGWVAFNRGFACKDSVFVRDCARRALEARPAVLVVYSGHNDFANWWPRNPRRRIWLEEHAWLYDVERGLASTRSFTLLARSFRFSLVPKRTKALASPEIAEEAAEVVLAKFSEDISRVIEDARAHEAEVMLVSVVGNLHEFPVRKEDWERGPARLAARNPGLAAWAENFERGVALHRAGRFAEAVVAFEKARDLNPRGRARSSLNDRVRALAAAHANAHLVDFERELHATAGAEGVGCAFFGDEGYCDQFHPNGRTQRMIARAVVAEMRRIGLVSGG